MTVHDQHQDKYNNVYVRKVSYESSYFDEMQSLDLKFVIFIIIFLIQKRLF